MKRTLALILVLATLLCLFPFAVSAEEAEPVAQSEESGSYLDLYVKEGLVALYDAYSATAQEAYTDTENHATWTAVDFYEKEGYDAYLDPASYYAQMLCGTQLIWKWEDGYLLHYPKNDTPATSGNGRDDPYSFIRWYGETLPQAVMTSADAQFTVQQVYQLLGGMTQDMYLSTPKVENGAVVNSATITAFPYTYGGGFTIGDLGSSYDYHTWVFDGKFQQGGVWRASFTGCYSNSAYFLGEYYNVLQGLDSSTPARWVRAG